MASATADYARAISFAQKKVLPVFLPRIVLTAFSSEQDRARGERAALRLLQALTDINVDYLLSHPNTPLLYQSGVRYKEQAYDLGQEDWHEIPAALLAKKTDCKVLAAWRAAELRVRGIAAQPHLMRQASLRTALGMPDYSYHVVVRHPDGRLEDPSKILGMK